MRRGTRLAAALASVLFTVSCAQVRFVELAGKTLPTYGVAMTGGPNRANEGQDALLQAVKKFSDGQKPDAYRSEAERALRHYEGAIAQQNLSPQQRAAVVYNEGLCQLLLGNARPARVCFEQAALHAPAEQRYQIMAQHAHFVEVDARLEAVNERLAVEMSKAREALGSAQEEQFKRIRANLDKSAEAINRDLSNQNAILDRAVGKYIPIQIPPELEQRLAQIESLVKNPKDWPASHAALGKYRDELNAAAKSVPPWADKETLPRFSALRWAADAFGALLSSANPQGVDQAKLLDTIEDLLESSGDSADKGLVERLTEVKGKVAAAVAAEKRKSACDEATAALAGKDADRLSAAWVALESFAKDDKDGAIIQLRAVLRTQVVNLQSEAQIEALGKDLERVEALPDWRLKMAGLNQILQSCTAQQLSLSLEKGVSAKVTDGLKDLNKRTQARVDALTAARMLDYQKWALRCIKDFNAEVGEVHKRARTQSRLWGETWWDTDYQQVAAAMNKHLTPVNTGLLDLSVSQLYNRAFDTGWKLLEKKMAFQEWVAEKAAEQPKRGIGDE